MNVAIVGCGLIGKKRAAALAQSSGDKLKVVCDVDLSRARELGKQSGCESTSDWHKTVKRSDIDAVIVSTVNSELHKIAILALKSGKHVLCEKPLGRSGTEGQKMLDAALQTRVILKTGFNHRFHPAIAKAKEFLDAGKIGRCLSVYLRYGHGGRTGMESEWRCQKSISGGGELLDQGVHGIDLIRWFGGEITEVFAKTETKHWKIKVEDTANAILSTREGVTASLSVSWTYWKNIFSFDIYGSKGYLSIQGLGGSYGPETLEWGVRKPGGGRPAIKTFHFPENDLSWGREWREFSRSIRTKRQPLGSGSDGVLANRVVDALYRSSRLGKPISLKGSYGF